MIRPPPLAVVALMSGVLLAGCGGSAGSPAVATVASTTIPKSPAANAGSGQASSGTTPSGSQLQQDLLKYARCMRANGVPDFPDPSAGGGFEFRPGAGFDRSSPAFKAAQAKCWKLLPGGGPPAPGSTTHPSAQALARMVIVAQCMRRHGITDFPDPRTSVPSLPAGGGMISDIDGVIFVFPATIDVGSPAFKRAAVACKFPLHNH
jgi:hypothetical protein